MTGALRECAAAFERDLLKPLWGLNGWPMRYMPSLEPEPIRYEDPAALAESLKNMAMAGAVLNPEDPVVDYYRMLLGAPASDPLPPPPREEDDGVDL